MSNIIRKYKIHQIIPCLSATEIQSFIYIKDILDNLIPIKLQNGYNPKNTFYMNQKGECIYLKININKNIYIRNKILNTLTLDYNLDIDDIEDILRYLLKNNEYERIEAIYHQRLMEIETAYKNNNYVEI